MNAFKASGHLLCLFLQPNDQKVHIFQLSNDTLQETRTLQHDGGLMDVSYSPDGSYLAAVDNYRKVFLYQLPEYEVRKMFPSLDPRRRKRKKNKCRGKVKNLGTFSFRTKLAFRGPYTRQKLILLPGHPTPET